MHTHTCTHTCTYHAAGFVNTVEDQNFALFNYVNELNGDIELVQEQIREVRPLVVRNLDGTSHDTSDQGGDRKVQEPGN